MERPTCIKTFFHQFDAEVAARTLEVHGIDVHLSSDDAGETIPGHFSAGGVMLFVAEADADHAIEILVEDEGPPNGDDHARKADGEAGDDLGARETRSNAAWAVIGGLSWIAGGIGVTVATYKLAGPRGTFIVAYGAVLYGIYRVVQALRVLGKRHT